MPMPSAKGLTVGFLRKFLEGKPDNAAIRIALPGDTVIPATSYLVYWADINSVCIEVNPQDILFIRYAWDLPSEDQA